MASAKSGDTVKVHYTGKFEDGTVFDSSEGKDPLLFHLGKNEIIPGFEKAIIGMEPGEKKTVEIEAADAYGEPRKELVQKVEKKHLPKDLTPEVGLQLQIGEPKDGVVVTITEIDDETITLDGNHPLAGKKLIFNVELSEIVS